jgi:hypothetical protein
MARDQQKIEKCAAAGITLIHIPYWYDRGKVEEGGSREEERGGRRSEVG